MELNVASDPLMRAHDTSQTDPTVFVIDGDISVRESVELLVTTAGWRVDTFASAEEFRSSPRPTGPCCLVLEVALPGLSGLELQRQLASQSDIPIVFITGAKDLSTVVRAIKAGAVAFLGKPIDDEALLNAIREALETSSAALREEAAKRVLTTRFESLTRREREVMELVVSGLLNKQIAGDLGLSEITVKHHRGRMMRRMEANCVPDLVRMAAALGLR